MSTSRPPSRVIKTVKRKICLLTSIAGGKTLCKNETLCCFDHQTVACYMHVNQSMMRQV